MTPSLSNLGLGWVKRTEIHFLMKVSALSTNFSLSDWRLHKRPWLQYFWGLAAAWQHQAPPLWLKMHYWMQLKFPQNTKNSLWGLMTTRVLQKKQKLFWLCPPGIPQKFCKRVRCISQHLKYLSYWQGAQSHWWTAAVSSKTQGLPGKWRLSSSLAASICFTTAKFLLSVRRGCGESPGASAHNIPSSWPNWTSWLKTECRYCPCR